MQPTPVVIHEANWTGVANSDAANFYVNGTLQPAVGQPLPGKLCATDAQVTSGYDEQGQYFVTATLALSSLSSDPNSPCAGNTVPLTANVSYTSNVMGGPECQNKLDLPRLRLATDTSKGEAPGFCRVSGTSITCQLNAKTVDGQAYPGCGFGIKPGFMAAS